MTDVNLHRGLANDESSGDLAIRLPGEDEVRDPSLARRQLTGGASAAANPLELCACPLCPQRRWEGALLFVCLAVVCGAVFTGALADKPHIEALLYLPLPFLLWAALRFGPLGTSTAFALVVFVTIFGAIRGQGPFVTDLPTEGALVVQIFLVSAGVPLLFLTAVITERAQAFAVIWSAPAEPTGPPTPAPPVSEGEPAIGVRLPSDQRSKPATVLWTAELLLTYTWPTTRWAGAAETPVAETARIATSPALSARRRGNRSMRWASSMGDGAATTGWPPDAADHATPP